METREQNHNKFHDRFTTMDILVVSVDIYRFSEIIRQNIKHSAKDNFKYV
jgi:hypothetical protein